MAEEDHLSILRSVGANTSKIWGRLTDFQPLAADFCRNVAAAG
jgi:hypothetical protein